MQWVILGAAILSEIAGTLCLKLSEGFSHLLPSIAIFPCYALSLTQLTFALKTIPVSTAYAIWSAVGTALIALIGIAFFREPAGTVKLVSLGLVIIGVVGLHLGDRLSNAI